MCYLVNRNEADVFAHSKINAILVSKVIYGITPACIAYLAAGQRPSTGWCKQREAGWRLVFVVPPSSSVKVSGETLADQRRRRGNEAGRLTV